MRVYAKATWNYNPILKSLSSKLGELSHHFDASFHT